MHLVGSKVWYEYLPQSLFSHHQQPSLVFILSYITPPWGQVPGSVGQYSRPPALLCIDYIVVSHLRCYDIQLWKIWDLLSPRAMISWVAYLSLLEIDPRLVLIACMQLPSLETHSWKHGALVLAPLNWYCPEERTRLVAQPFLQRVGTYIWWVDRSIVPPAKVVKEDEVCPSFKIERENEKAKNTHASIIVPTVGTILAHGMISCLLAQVLFV